MADENRSAPMRAAERAFKQTLRTHQVDQRVREATEGEAETEAKIARLRQLRLAKEAEEKKG